MAITDFDLSAPRPDWGGCVRFNLSETDPAYRAVPCSYPIYSPVIGVASATVLYGAAIAQTGVQGSAGAVISILADATAEWDANVWRGPGLIAGDAFEETVGVSTAFRSWWEIPERLRAEAVERWESGTPVPGETSCPANGLPRRHARKYLNWGAGAHLGGGRVVSPFVAGWRRHKAEFGVWQDGTGIDHTTTSPFVIGWPRKRIMVMPYQVATVVPSWPLEIPWIVPGRWPHGTPQVWLPWQEAGRPAFIWPIPVEPVIPEPETFHGDSDLLLSTRLPLWSGCVVFRLGATRSYAEACSGLTAPRRFIIVVNSLSLITLSDGLVVPCDSMEIRGDLDSWAWGLTAQFIGHLPDSLASEQREVLATVNGHEWKFVVEECETQRGFGSIQGGVTGRSLAAYLAEPYVLPRSRLESTERTVQQCAEDELYGTGWALDWRIKKTPSDTELLDWLIPAGVLSYESETPLTALRIIAESAGAVLQSHASEKTIIVMPRYAVSAWALSAATPDIEIPEDIITTMSKRWVPNSLYRGVYVSGRDQGVLVRVIIDGTDGREYRQMVTDPLITHVDAGRERGRSILCAGGKRALVTMVLPLMADPGLIFPGKIVQVNQSPVWMAYVTALTVSGRHGRAWQTVELEKIEEARWLAD